MENEAAIKQDPTPASYEQQIVQYEALVHKLKEEHEKNPTPESQLELNRKTDTLRHLQNLAKGNPKARIPAAAEKARSSVLSRAITQPLR